MLALLYCMLFLVLIVRGNVVFRHYRINTEFLIITGFILYYIIPGIRHSIPGFKGMYFLRHGSVDNSSVEGFIAILLFLVIYFVVYHSKMRLLPRNELFIPNESKKVKRIATDIIVFSGFFFLMYCSLFGGVKVLLQSIDSIRGGLVSSSSPKFEFVGKLYSIIIYAPALTYAYWKKDASFRPLIVVSVIFALIVQISKGGRGSILIFFLLFIVAKINTVNSISKTYRRISQIMVIGFICIVIYRPLISSAGLIAKQGVSYAFKKFIELLMSGGRYSVSSPQVAINSFLDSFDHYFVSLETAIIKVNSGIHHHDYFRELVSMVVAPIPSLLLGIQKPISNTVYNSLYITGIENYGQIPSGIVGAAFYSGGYPWIILYATTVAIFGRIIDNFYLRINKTVTFSHHYYVLLMLVYFGFALSGDFPDNFKKEFFSIIIFIIIGSKMKNIGNSIQSSSNNIRLQRCIDEKDCSSIEY